MSKVIFILLLWSGTGQGDALSSTEFDSEAACRFAQAEIAKNWGRSVRLWTLCVPKEVGK